MEWGEFTQNVLIILFGTGTVGGIFATILKYAIKKALAKRDAERQAQELARLEEEKRRHREIEEYNEIIQRHKKAIGKVLFWIRKGIKRIDENHEYWDEEMDNAWATFRTVEEELKAHEQKIISQRRSDY